MLYDFVMKLNTGICCDEEAYWIFLLLRICVLNAVEDDIKKSLINFEPECLMVVRVLSSGM
jgi:hypothetical protein